MTCKNCPLCDL